MDYNEQLAINYHPLLKKEIRYIRAKDVGTRLASLEVRNKKIAENGRLLDDSTQLKGRSIYWFITTEHVQIFPVTEKDRPAVIWKESVIHADKYLNQIEIKSNRCHLQFQFPDGSLETIKCYPKQPGEPTSNKRFKVMHDREKVDDDESQLSRKWTSLSNNNMQLTPPQDLLNGTQLPGSQPLIVNILLFVPAKLEYVQMTLDALRELGFVEEARSDNQHLFSQKVSLNATRHILVLPYQSRSRSLQLQGFIQFASEILLLIENENQDQILMTIAQVNNMNSKAESTWSLSIKDSMNYFGLVALDYIYLSQSTQTLLSIYDFQNAFVGGASCTTHCIPFAEFLTRWLVGGVGRIVVQNIFVCFMYEPKIRAFTEYAQLSLAAVGIEAEYTLTVKGSILVYVKCPSYFVWYLLQKKDSIFAELEDYGLTEIYECYISDIEDSMHQTENQEFSDELLYLKEQMISERTAENAPNNRSFHLHKTQLANNENEELNLSSLDIDGSKYQQSTLISTTSEKIQQKNVLSQDVLFQKYFMHFCSKLVKDRLITKEDSAKWLKTLAENAVTLGWTFVSLTKEDFTEMNFNLSQCKVMVKIQQKFLALKQNKTKAHLDQQPNIASVIKNTSKMVPKSSAMVKASSLPLCSINEHASSIIGNLKFILNKFRAGLVEREQHCSLMLLSLLCGEHSLLLGPPGVAKSQLCSRITSLISPNTKMFSRLLTKFTLPEELFGPLSIQDLKLNRHNQITKGYLPEAQVAYLDEIFKANSAILNSLLTILNERKFDNGTICHNVPLVTAFAASNEYPSNGELQALYDRFLFRMWLDPVTSFAGFRELINPLNVISNNVEIPEAFLFTPEALAVIRQESQTKELDEAVFVLLHNVMTQLDKKKIYVSPRRWIKIRQVIQMVAHTSEVQRPLCLSDCAILKHLTWNRHTQIDDVWNMFLQALSTTLQLFPQHTNSVVMNCNNHFWIPPQDCKDMKQVCYELQKGPRIPQALHLMKRYNAGQVLVNESTFST